MQNKNKKIKNQVTNEVSKEFRDTVANMFIEFINSKATQDKCHSGLETCIDTPVNAISNIKYRGINRLYLLMLMQKYNLTDNRFLTFRQAEKERYMVKKGSKSILVEYWFPIDMESNKVITWEEYSKIQQTGTDKKENSNIVLTAKYFHVFNASQISGIPEKSQSVGNIEPTLIINRLAKEMGVKICYDSENIAFYKADTDDIHLPPLNSFISAYDFASTVLLALIHATGSQKRLNRFKDTSLSVEENTKEELIAEIASIFLTQHLGAVGECIDHGNHKIKEYLQSWIKAINADRKHKYLMDCIKEAEKISNYLEKFL